GTPQQLRGTGLTHCRAIAQKSSLAIAVPKGRWPRPASSLSPKPAECRAATHWRISPKRSSATAAISLRLPCSLNRSSPLELLRVSSATPARSDCEPAHKSPVGDCQGGPIRHRGRAPPRL